MFPAKRKHTGKSSHSEIVPLGLFPCFFFFFNFALPLPLCPGVGDCSRVRACTAWREYPLLHHTAAYKDSLLLQNKSNVWGETQEVPLYYHDLGMLLWFSNGWSQQSAACCYQLKESFFDTRFSFLKTLSFILPDALSIFLSVCLSVWLTRWSMIVQGNPQLLEVMIWMGMAFKGCQRLDICKKKLIFNI